MLWLADEARSLGEGGLEEGALIGWTANSLDGFGLGLAMLGLGWSGREERDCLGEMLSPVEEKTELFSFTSPENYPRHI